MVKKHGRSQQRGPTLPAPVEVPEAMHDDLSDESDAEREAEQRRQQTFFKLARKLAHNDKAVRVRSVRVLKQWLNRRTDIDQDDMLKIWKGIFYCFWMSDKTAVQQELAERLSKLITGLAPARAIAVLDGFFVTMNREWTGIDRLRMDKFMSLVRKFVTSSFMYLAAQGWDTEITQQWMRMMCRTPLNIHDTKNRGVYLHVTDVYLAELTKAATATAGDRVSRRGLTFERLVMLLKPFLSCLSTSDDSTRVDRVMQTVMLPLLERFELSAEAATGANDNDDDDNNDSGDNENAAATAAKESLPLVGNAGRLASILTDLASDKRTRDNLRATLYKLAVPLKSVSEMESDDDDDDDSDEDDDEDESEEDSISESEDEEAPALVPTKKQKQQQQKQQRQQLQQQQQQQKKRNAASPALSSKRQMTAAASSSSEESEDDDMEHVDESDDDDDDDDDDHDDDDDDDSDDGSDDSDDEPAFLTPQSQTPTSMKKNSAASTAHSSQRSTPQTKKQQQKQQPQSNSTFHTPQHPAATSGTPVSKKSSLKRKISRNDSDADADASVDSNRSSSNSSSSNGTFSTPQPKKQRRTTDGSKSVAINLKHNQVASFTKKSAFTPKFTAKQLLRREVPQSILTPSKEGAAFEERRALAMKKPVTHSHGKSSSMRKPRAASAASFF